MGEGRTKAIGFWAGVCLLANNITGPGMVDIPGTFQKAGWLFPTLVFVFGAVYASLACLMLAKALTFAPGNGRYGRQMEFSNLAAEIFPRPLYLLTIITLIFTFQAANMSAIIESSQTMDSTLLAIVKKTCGLVVYAPSGSNTTAGFKCIGADSDTIITDSPFGDDYVISLGYIVVMLVTIPVGFFNLEDNMWVQVGGFLILLYCMLAWVIQFFEYGLEPSRMPAWNKGGIGSVLSTVVFNFGFVVTIPSWLNEKSDKVSVVKSVWVSVIISATMFLALGLFGGLGFDFGQGQDLLAAITSSTNPKVKSYSMVAAYLFPPAALLTGIPVFSIIIRYNLVENKICGKTAANLFAVVFPWVVSLIFYTGNLLTNLMNWSSALFFVILNFTFPLLVYALGSRRYDADFITGINRDGGALLDPTDDESHIGPAWRVASAVNSPSRTRGKTSKAGQSDMDDYGDDVHGFAYAAGTGSGQGADREEFDVIPTGVRRLLCGVTDERLAWILVGLSGPLAIATLVLQALDANAD